jgi:membrane-associated phospholipid phosphatase
MALLAGAALALQRWILISPAVARGIGATEAIQSHVTKWLVPVVVAITQLGDPILLGLVLAGLYWRSADRRGATAAAAGVALATYALTVCLKHLFALPRPAEPLVSVETLPWLFGSVYEISVSADGYGFPSGHALMTTVVALQVAGLLRVGRYRHRILGALVVVVAVAVSRLALGVHYLIDVVVGIVLGIAIVVAARAASNRRDDPATVALGTAVAGAGLAVAYTGGTTDAVYLLGAALGGFAGWQFVRLGTKLVEAGEAPTAARAFVRHGTIAALPLLVLYGAVEWFPLLSAPSLGGILGLVVATVVVSPVALESDHLADVLRFGTFWCVAILRAIGRLLVRIGFINRTRLTR